MRHSRGAILTALSLACLLSAPIVLATNDVDRPQDLSSRSRPERTKPGMVPTVDFAATCEGWTILITGVSGLAPGQELAGVAGFRLRENGGSGVVDCIEPVSLIADDQGRIEALLSAPWCEPLDGTFRVRGILSGDGVSLRLRQQAPITCSDVPQCTGRIGDFVWNDGEEGVSGECDGAQPSSGMGINGVPVTLLDAGGNVIATTTTGDATVGGQLQAGRYDFDGLCAGEYHVMVGDPGEGFVPAPVLAVGEQDDSNPNPAGVVLGSNTANDLSIDFGFCTASSGQGCGGAFWQANPIDWFGYTPADFVGEPFFEAEEYGLGGITLQEAMTPDTTLTDPLQQAARNLVEVGVAALLNGTNPNVDYPLNEAEVLDAVNGALGSFNQTTLEQLTAELAQQNAAGCPL